VHTPGTSCRTRSRQSHTAQYQEVEARVYYRFHPRAGQPVRVIKQAANRGQQFSLIEQPDGTRAQIPAWMLEPAAGSLTIGSSPRLRLSALNDLRRIVCSVLSFPLCDQSIQGGQDAGKQSTDAMGFVSGAKVEQQSNSPDTSSDRPHETTSGTVAGDKSIRLSEAAAESGED
jgi:hypothetical protein